MFPPPSANRYFSGRYVIVAPLRRSAACSGSPCARFRASVISGFLCLLPEPIGIFRSTRTDRSGGTVI